MPVVNKEATPQAELPPGNPRRDAGHASNERDTAPGDAADDTGPSDRPSQGGADVLPRVTLPKGGGAIRGIGEKFSVNPATGTGLLHILLPLSPGRSGFTPGS